MVGFSSVFYGVPDVLAGLALMSAHGIAEGLFGVIGLFAFARGLMTLSGGGLVDPAAIEYKIFYGGGDWLIGFAFLPSDFAYFFFFRGLASAVGLVL